MNAIAPAIVSPQVSIDSTPGSVPLLPTPAPPPPVAPAATPPATVGGKRGRPPGATDKRPRKRRAAKAAPKAQAPKAPPKVKAAPPNPFAGGVEGDAPPEAPADPTKPRGKAGAPSAKDLISIESDQIVAMACMVLNVAVVKLATSKWGPAGSVMSLDEAEAAEIQRLGVIILDKHLPKMSPEWALVATLALIYTGKGVQLSLAQRGVTLESVQADMAKAEAQGRAAAAAQRQAA